MIFMGYVMVQAVSHQFLTTKDQVQSQTNPCGICGAQTDTGTGFSLNTLIFPCQWNSTHSPSSFSHLSL